MSEDAMLAGGQIEVTAADSAPVVEAQADPSADAVDLSDLQPAGDGEPEPTPAEEGEISAEDLEPDADAADDAEPEPVEDFTLSFLGRETAISADLPPAEIVARAQEILKESEQATTRKTQEVAELRKSAETGLQAAQRVQTLTNEALDAYSQVRGLEASVEQMEQQLMQADRYANPDQYRFLSDDIARARAVIDEKRYAVTHAEQQAAVAQEAEMTRRHEEGKAIVLKKIPSFKEAEVVAYVAEKYGIDKELAAKTWGRDPGVAEMAYKAMLHDRAAERAKRRSAPKPATAVAPVVRGGQPAASADPSHWNDAQWNKELGI